MAENNISIITMENICKSFYGVEVLSDVTLDVFAGEVHVICGENGAGKSTLIKTMAGLHKPTKGIIKIDGVETVFNSTKDAEKAGVAIVYQELSLCPTITIAENIYLNREFGSILVNRKQMKARAAECLEEVGLKVSTDLLVKDLSIAEMQMVQIAKAVSQNARLIILDEPCSSLTDEESDKLFALIKRLKQKGVGMVYIDHRLENIKKIGDRVTVLRDGKMIGTIGIKEATEERIIEMMVGRKIEALYQKTNNPSEEIVLEVNNLKNKRIDDISFKVRAGEVFGLGGMVGSGRSEIIRAIFGADDIQPNGEIIVNGKRLRRNTPLKSIRHGMGYVPEDRKLQSLILAKDSYYNMSLVFLDLINRGMLVNSKSLFSVAEEQVQKLKVKILKKSAEVAELSGGNQQKIVIGKWLVNKELKLLLLDEPTRGVDVGVKAEIYRLIDELACQGVAIVLVTSELPELLGLSDRIAIINKGRIAGTLEKPEFSQENFMKLCM